MLIYCEYTRLEYCQLRKYHYELWLKDTVLVGIMTASLYLALALEARLAGKQILVGSET